MTLPNLTGGLYFGIRSTRGLLEDNPDVRLDNDPDVRLKIGRFITRAPSRFQT